MLRLSNLLIFSLLFLFFSCSKEVSDPIPIDLEEEEEMTEEYPFTVVYKEINNETDFRAFRNIDGMSIEEISIDETAIDDHESFLDPINELWIHSFIFTSDTTVILTSIDEEEDSIFTTYVNDVDNEILIFKDREGSEIPFHEFYGTPRRIIVPFSMMVTDHPTFFIDTNNNIIYDTTYITLEGPYHIDATEILSVTPSIIDNTILAQQGSSLGFKNYDFLFKVEE